MRHGGDEFIILYNDVTKERFSEKLEAIVKGVREIRFPDLPDMKLSISVGGEYYENPDQSLYYNMVRRADEKLYRAKEGGRDRFVL
ncbi:diguanylate cyclase [Clostridium sp. AM58-1XD]|nr:diguanylate cyclase [Clostridium sp. AM58-1XD]